MMIRKLLSKYFMEVIPSIVATVVGAYIVTHYINARPAADNKPPAAAAAPAVPAKSEAAKSELSKPELARSEPVRSEARKPEPAKSETAKADETDTPNEKAASRNPRHHPLAAKEKAAAKSAAPAEAASAEDRRDANDIARAAIERLRAEQPRAAEATRSLDSKTADKMPERARVNAVVYPPPPAVVAPAPVVAPVQSLPPAAATAQPPVREIAIPAAPMPVATPSPVRTMDDERAGLTPPADIPERPLDLRAKDNKSVAEDVVSAARSVLQSVVPH